MKAFAVCALVVAAAACQPQVERQASAEREVSVVTDAVLVRQNKSKTKQDAVRTLLIGQWTCKAISDGIDMTMVADFRQGGVLQVAMHMVSPQMDLNAVADGKWVLTGFELQQSFASIGDFTGTLNGAAVTPGANVQLKEAILQLSPDPEPMTISDGKFTMTDGEGVVTTCTQ